MIQFPDVSLYSVSVSLAVVLYATVVVVWFTSRPVVPAEIRRKLADRAKQRDQVKHKALTALPPDEEAEPVDEDHFFLDAHALQALVASGTTTHETLMRARILRTRRVGKDRLNAVTEELYDESLAHLAALTRKHDDDTQAAHAASKAAAAALASVPASPGLSSGIPVFDQSVQTIGSLFSPASAKPSVEAGAPAASAGVARGPLWGMAVSIKDQFTQKGTDSTCGAAARAFKPAPEDGLLVQALRWAGACCYVRSNTPQLLMMPETENAVWGRTDNPWDAARTPGGSSGGEAALVASGCSVLGLASDIGGSIRIPAHFCGLVGFKPSSSRITSQGQEAPRLGGVSGQVAVESAAGPIARSVRDCAAVMEALTAPRVLARDPDSISRPVLQAACLGGGPRPLRVAYIASDGWFEPSAPCARAVAETVASLTALGHECRPFPLSAYGPAAFLTYIALMGADGNWHNFQQALEGEPLYKSYTSLHLYTALPNALRPLIAYALGLAGERRKAAMLTSQLSGGLAVRSYYEHVVAQKRLRAAFRGAMEKGALGGVLFLFVPLTFVLFLLPALINPPYQTIH